MQLVCRDTEDKANRFERMAAGRTYDDRLKLSFFEAVNDLSVRYPKLSLAFHGAVLLKVAAMTLPSDALPYVYFGGLVGMTFLPEHTPFADSFNASLNTLFDKKYGPCERALRQSARYDRIRNLCVSRKEKGKGGKFLAWREQRARRKSDEFWNKAVALREQTPDWDGPDRVI